MAKYGYNYNGEWVKTGVTFGSVLSIVISFTLNKSVFWAIVHGLLSWVYVLYYIVVK